MAKKSFDWKEVGQFVAMMVKLFSIVIAAFKKAKHIKTAKKN